MKTRSSLFTIFYFLSSLICAYCQTDSISNWQDQIISRLDPSEFNEVAYSRLLEMISDLSISRNDTVYPTRIRQDIILRSDYSPKDKDYLGEDWSQTIRYKIQVGKDWSGGLVLNKDAGEQFRLRFPLFDSYNYYVSYKPSAKKTILDRIILGKYRVKLGSGLLINQQFSLGKSISHDTFITNGTLFSPHSSTDEYNYMQGALVEMGNKHFSFSPFFSYKRIDAVVSGDTITSIPTDGYHRTLNEEAKRDKAAVLNAGMHASLRSYWAEIGMNVLYTRFPHPFIRPTRTYNIYYYRGQQLLQGSLDYHVHRYGFQLRGETALDQDLNIATINQLSHSIGEDWKASVLYRYFGQKYQQLYGATTSEGSSMQGEQGVMLSVEGEPLAHWKVNLMVDYFRLSNITYGYDAPLSGYELSTQAQYKETKTTLLLSYRLKFKEAFRHSMDATISYTLKNALLFKTQFRSKVFSSKKTGGYSFGYAISQSIGWNRTTSPLSIEAQGTWFDAQDYETRLYLSEKNILYGFSIPMLYGRGIRLSLTGSYKINKMFSLDMKYALAKGKSNLCMQVKVKI